MFTQEGFILVMTSLTGEKRTFESPRFNSLLLIVYRKGPFGSKSANKWFYTSDCSDSSVRQVHYEEVSKTPAYMLFYEKMSDTDYI